jgi:6-phosphofructokinase
VVAEELKERTGFDTRVTILGHVQRGGTPTAFDRVLATRYGIAAIEAVHDEAFGQMVALRGDAIVRVSLEEAVAEVKTVDPEMFHRVAVPFFG